MVRSDSADEEQIMNNNEDYDLMEEDEDMNTGSGALPVIIPEWNAVRSGNQQQQQQQQLIAGSLANNVAVAAAVAAAAANNSLRNAAAAAAATNIGHAPLLTNRSISQPAQLSPASADPDKSFRIRRQIANCNERRRMQSINAGFMSLRALLPRKEGEKLSKAAILQQTADMVHQLLAEKARFCGGGGGGGGEAVIKRPKLEEDNIEMEQRTTIRKLQASLENERSTRKMLEQQVAQLRDMLNKSTTVTPTCSPINAATTSFPLIIDSPERKPSIAETTALLNLNGGGGSPCTSAAARLAFDTTVIRPTPLAPISVEVSSPSLSTPSPLTVANAPPIIYPTNQSTQSSILFANVVKAAVTSSLSNTGASTPVGLPTISALHQQPSAFVSTQPSHSQRSLQTILDAIRHLEGGAFLPPSPPPPATSTTQTSLVR